MEYLTFKIWPDRPKKFKKFYFKVFIFGRKKSMYEVRDSLVADGANKMTKPHNYHGLCSAFNSKKDKYQYGVLMFYRKTSKRSGVVSHEITHATNYWWKHTGKKNIFKDSKADEMFAWIQGNLVSQYWKTWYTLPKNKR